MEVEGTLSSAAFGICLSLISTRNLKGPVNVYSKCRFCFILRYARSIVYLLLIPYPIKLARNPVTGKHRASIPTVLKGPLVVSDDRVYKAWRYEEVLLGFQFMQLSTEKHTV